MSGTERSCCPQLNQGFAVMRRVIEGVSQIEPVIKIVGKTINCGLKLWDTAVWILVEQISDAQMVMCGSIASIEFNGAHKVPDRLVTLVQDRQKESNLILDAGGVRIETSRLLPQRK